MIPNSQVRVPIPAGLAQPLVDALTARLTASQRPVFVALDGRSGAGKSTPAAALTEACGTRGVTVAVIEGDEYRTDWEARWSAAEDHDFGRIMPPDRFDHVL